MVVDQYIVVPLFCTPLVIVIVFIRFTRVNNCIQIKTTLIVRPSFQGPMCGLKIEGTLYMYQDMYMSIDPNLAVVHEHVLHQNPGQVAIFLCLLSVPPSVITACVREPHSGGSSTVSARTWPQRTDCCSRR